MWTWLSGRPLTICQWEKNQTTRKGNVAVILNESTIDNQCIIDYFNRYKRAAYICEISNGKTKPLLIHIKFKWLRARLVIIFLVVIYHQK